MKPQRAQSTQRSQRTMALCSLCPLWLILLFLSAFPIFAQNTTQPSGLKTITISAGGNRYYTFRYRDTKPDDVPQEVYDALWEIQLEVIDNFTYDYDVSNGRRRARSFTSLEDYYTYGKGVCEDYSNFFILLLRERGLVERGLTENLYKVSGRGRGGHAWLEYHTENNVYIIDPTWSDDYSLRVGGEQTKQRFRESPVYGKEAFFITYEEDKIIYRRQGYTHSTFYDKVYTPLWNKTMISIEEITEESIEDIIEETEESTGDDEYEEGDFE